MFWKLCLVLFGWVSNLLELGGRHSQGEGRFRSALGNVYWDAVGLARLLAIPRSGRIVGRDTEGGRDSSMISARQEVSDSLAWCGYEAFTKILNRGIGFGSDSLWLRREEGGAQ